MNPSDEREQEREQKSAADRATKRSRWVVRIQRRDSISQRSILGNRGGDVGRVSSDEGGRGGQLKMGGEEGENDRVTSLRSRVRRRASRCQIYRRVLDGACLRLLISPVAFNIVPDVTHVSAGLSTRYKVGVSHEFVIVAKIFCTR